MEFVRKYRYAAWNWARPYAKGRAEEQRRTASDGSLWERIARYEALSNGTDLARAVSIIIGMIEGSVDVKQFDAARHERLARNGITPLSQDYWREQSNRADLLFCLIAVGVWATCLKPERSLPIHEWLNDAHLHDVAGPEVDRFFALLTGTERRTDGSLLEEAAMALRRIREDTLPPNDLFICHFRLLNALSSGEWGKPVGDALAKIVSAQWVNACEHQPFALITPSLYAPLLRVKCEDAGRSGFSKVASILKTAAVAAGVGLADSGISFSLEWSVERAIHALLPKRERAIGREIANSVSGALPTLLLRRRPL